ncbi:hypothetical protein [Brevibacterium album]|uniref:hypothetical protein n=1 Tax=Brevibacterium album TaxID=417948 RepID=UPI00048E2D92|nr:hypothetical protein [Brevibacterium album]
MSNEATVGTVDWDGKTYEIDWPHDLDDDTRRSEDMGAIYLDGEQVGECCAQFGERFTSADQVIDAAYRVIRYGDTDDQD